MAACESAVFDIFVIALWLPYVSAVRCFICFCHSSQFFYSDTTSDKQIGHQAHALIYCPFFCKWRLYIMAIGKCLGITQHVIWPGGSSCHFSLAVAGSHAKGCNIFLFSPLRTHVFFLHELYCFARRPNPNLTISMQQAIAQKL